MAESTIMNAFRAQLQDKAYKEGFEKLLFFHQGSVHSSPAKLHLDPWPLMGQLRVMSVLHYVFC